MAPSDASEITARVRLLVGGTSRYVASTDFENRQPVMDAGVTLQDSILEPALSRPYISEPTPGWNLKIVFRSVRSPARWMDH